MDKIDRIYKMARMDTMLIMDIMNRTGNINRSPISRRSQIDISAISSQCCVRNKCCQCCTQCYVRNDSLQVLPALYPILRTKRQLTSATSAVPNVSYKTTAYKWYLREQLITKPRLPYCITHANLPPNRDGRRAQR